MKTMLAGLALLTLAGGAAVQDQEPPRRPGGGGGEMMRGMMMGPPGGGAAAMVVHADHIFVLTGSKLVKVDPKEMKIVAELEMPQAAPAGGGRPGPGGGQPGERPTRRPGNE